MAPTDSEDITVRLKAVYDNRGVEDLRADMWKLQQIQMEKGVKGIGLSRSEKQAMMVTRTRLNHVEREQARNQRQLLFTGLGVMFFFMALSRALSGLLQPAADIVGIFDIFNLILTMLFLPIMLKLLPVLLSLLKIVMDTGEETKLLVGGLALLAWALATIFQWAATIALGLQSIFGATAVTTAIGGIGTAIAAALASPLVVLGLFVAAAWALDGALRAAITGINEFIASLVPPDILKAVAESPGIQALSGEYGMMDTLLGAPGEAVKNIPLIGGIAQGVGQTIWDWSPAGMGYNMGRSSVSVIIHNSNGIQNTTSVDQSGSGAVSPVPEISVQG